MISQELIDELGMIMREDHALQLDHSEATEVAEFLTGYFKNLINIDKKERQYGSSSDVTQNYY